VRSLPPWAAFVTIVGLAGCGKNPDQWAPLAQDAEWTYAVKTGLNSSVQTVKVVEPTPIDGERGWRLEGPGGESRLVWRRGKLYAAALGGTRFSPPILWLDPNKPPKPEDAPEFENRPKVRTLVSTAHRSFDAEIQSQTVLSKFRVGGKERSALKSTVRMTLGGRPTILTTWFSPGLGPVRQEIYNGEALRQMVDYLKGP